MFMHMACTYRVTAGGGGVGPGGMMHFLSVKTASEGEFWGTCALVKVRGD